MKKGILGLLALFLALGTACHTAVTPETPGPTEQGSTSEEPEPIDPYRQAAEAALAAMTREEKAWQLLIVRPEALTEDGTAVTVPLEEYRQEVFRFADRVEGYYRQCAPKQLPEDAFTRDGYTAFWNEWHRRRCQ